MLISSDRCTRPRSRVSANSSFPAENSGILDTLFRRHKKSVYRLCLRYLRHSDEAEDATMEIFECLARNIGKYPVGHFYSWIAVISRNHCHRILKRQARNGQLVRLYSRTGFPGDEEQLEKKFLLEKKLEHLQAGMKLLNNSQRRCIICFYFERQSYKEIAAQLDLPVGAVKSHIQNGKRNLRKHLSQMDR